MSEIFVRFRRCLCCLLPLFVNRQLPCLHTNSRHGLLLPRTHHRNLWCVKLYMYYTTPLHCGMRYAVVAQTPECSQQAIPTKWLRDSGVICMPFLGVPGGTFTVPRLSGGDSFCVRSPRRFRGPDKAKTPSPYVQMNCVFASSHYTHTLQLSHHHPTHLWGFHSKQSLHARTWVSLFDATEGTTLSWGDGFFKTVHTEKPRFIAVFAGRCGNATATCTQPPDDIWSPGGNRAADCCTITPHQRMHA